MLFTTKTNGKEMEIRKFEFNLFGENTYVIWDPATLQAAVVDPGMAEDFEADELIYFCTSRHLDVKYILLTHAHVDHTFGIEALQALLPRVPVIAHKADAPLAASRAQQAQMFHLRRSLEPLAFDRMVTDGSVLKLGDEEIKVIATPGHSPGGVCYCVPASKFVLTGDTLFAGSIGRTDLPGGNGHVLVHSILSGLMSLPSDTAVYPGHGPSTTIARERATNPFLR